MASPILTYIGGIISLLILIGGYFFLPWFSEGIIASVFSFVWIAVASISAVAFGISIRRKEQLALIRASWKKRTKTQKRSSKERVFIRQR